MKRCFTSLTALLCSAAILLCCLPMQALAAEFRMQTAYEDVLPDELTAQKEAPAAPGRTGSARLALAAEQRRIFRRHIKLPHEPRSV